jgi:EmrB/QacA subfamily drug resistance transporter
MPHQTVPSKPLALALLTAAQFMLILDASIVNVALPAIQEALHFSPAHLSWTVNAYALMFGGFLLLGGRFADLFGRRRVFSVGMMLFAVASFAGGFAHSEIQLIVCRGLQGLGAALISPAALSMISVIFEEGKERNKAFGVWGAVGGSGGAIGVLIGGMLTQWLGWEWIFFINVPLALGAAVLAPRLLVESRNVNHTSYDVPGAITITAGLVAIVYAIVDANAAGWGSLQTLGLLATGAALIGLFVVIELRAKEPLIAFSIFRLPTLRAANIFAVVHSASVLSLFYVAAIYMQLVLGYDALQAGFGLMPLSAVAILSSVVASQLSTRLGFKPVLVAGSATMAGGLLWFSQLSATGSYWSEMFGPSLVIGAGIGLVIVPMTIAALAGTDHSNAGLGSGLMNTSQQVGRAIGLAVVISIYTSTASDEAKAGANQAVALADGLAEGVLVMAGFCLAAMFIALTMRHTRTKQTQLAPVQGAVSD